MGGIGWILDDGQCGAGHGDEYYCFEGDLEVE